MNTQRHNIKNKTQRTRYVLYVLGFVVGIVLGSVIPAHAFSLNMVPPSIRVSVEADGTYQGSIELENYSEDSMPIVANVEDWVYAPDGGKNFVAPGLTPRSCAKWVTLKETSFVLEPRIPHTVGFSVKLPKKASGGYFAVIFFKSGMGPGTYQGQAVTFSGRMGSILYIDTKGKTTPRGRFTSFTVTSTPEKKLDVELTFVNEGNSYLTGEGQIVVQKVGSADPVETVRVPSLNSLPGDKVTRSVKTEKALAPGVYEVDFMADLGRIPVHKKSVTVRVQ